MTNLAMCRNFCTDAILHDSVLNFGSYTWRKNPSWVVTITLMLTTAADICNIHHGEWCPISTGPGSEPQVTFGGELQEKGCRFELKVLSPEDLNR